MLPGFVREDEAISRTTMMKHSDIVALLNRFACSHRDFAGRHFGHAYSDETHKTYVVVCIDEDEGACSCLGDVWLGLVRSSHIQPGSRRDGKIGSFDNDDFQYPASNRGMVAMVALGAEESLEYRRTTGFGFKIVVFDEILGKVWVVIQNVKDRVGLGLHPKGVHRLDVAIDAHDVTFASGDDDVWIIYIFDGTYAIFEQPDKEIIPARKPLVWVFRGFGISRNLQQSTCLAGQPTSLSFVKDFGGRLRMKVLGPGIEYLCKLPRKPTIAPRTCRVPPENSENLVIYVNLSAHFVVHVHSRSLKVLGCRIQI